MDPLKTDCTANTIYIEWQEQRGQFNNYIVKYRDKGSKDVFAVERTSTSKIQISNLKTEAVYEIKICVEDTDGDESLLTKTEVRTAASSASKLLQFGEKICNDPVIYRLFPLNIRKPSKGIQIREYFPEVNNAEEHSLLLLGASGSGKSTLVDAFINYVTDVSFADNFRFKITDKITQGEEDIICYKLRYQDGFKVRFNLNIIDVPGFEPGYNESIYNKMVSLFQSVRYISAACVVVPSFWRLTEDHRCIFNNILSLFGNDISYVIPLFTHDDSGDIKALDSLRDANVPCIDHVQLRFNNSQLLIGNEQMYFWNERQNTMNKLLGKPSNFVNCSTDKTSEVIKSRVEIYRFLLEANGLNQQIMEKDKILIKYALRYAHNKCPKGSGETKLDDKKIYINCGLCKQTCIPNCSFKVRLFWHIVALMEEIWSLFCCICSCCSGCLRSECDCAYSTCCSIKFLHRCTGCTCLCACFHHYRSYSEIHSDESQQVHDNEDLHEIVNDDEKWQIENEKQMLMKQIEEIYINISRQTDYIEKHALFNELPEEMKNFRKL